MGRFRKILAPDGTFWSHSVSYVESSAIYPNTEKTESLQPISINFFVGSKGKPFANWKANLERLPYR